MLPQTQEVSTSFSTVSEKPDKLGHESFVIPATRTSRPFRRSPDIYLFRLEESEDLAEGRDNTKIIMAITAFGNLYGKSASSNS